MTTKPPIPANLGDPYPRIAVDQADGGDFDAIRRMATFATDGWVFSPDGARAKWLPPAQFHGALITEALLHLLELGVIDIDHDRLVEVTSQGHPPYREGR